MRVRYDAFHIKDTTTVGPTGVNGMERGDRRERNGSSNSRKLAILCMVIELLYAVAMVRVFDVH